MCFLVLMGPYFNPNGIISRKNRPITEVPFVWFENSITNYQYKKALLAYFYVKVIMLKFCAYKNYSFLREPLNLVYSLT